MPSKDLIEEAFSEALQKKASDGHQDRQAKGGEYRPDVGDLQGARHNEHRDDKSASGEETDLEKWAGEY